MHYDIKHPELAPAGQKKIDWADQQMPVLREIRQQFTQSQPFKQLRIAACMHVTSETACLVLTLKAGGAQVAICASNPLSTQDDVAAALVKEHEISVFAQRDEDNATYYSHIDQVLATHPQLVIDDGADLISELHKQRPDLLPEILGATEETTTGVARLSSMARNGVLKFPVIAVNNARSKYLFDNRYGTGQSTVDGIMRATNMLLAGKNMVICGYGWCGKGIAMRAKGLGAIAIVVEINPMNALEAAMDGFFVTTMDRAAELGDIFVTASGDLNVIRRRHFELMKPGALLANAGHFNSEIEIQALEEMARDKEEIRPYLMAYKLPNKNLYLLGEGRLVNLSCGEGHPASVMDMSFANQALSLAHLAQQHRSFGPRVYPVPEEIDERVARLKLLAMGIQIDSRTQEQLDYQVNWESGT
ncbi:MAG TPA: adenosylhomocysteinase [Candidatus Obscuribacterales bacterium]